MENLENFKSWIENILKKEEYSDYEMIQINNYLRNNPAVVKELKTRLLTVNKIDPEIVAKILYERIHDRWDEQLKEEATRLFNGILDSLKRIVLLDGTKIDAHTIFMPHMVKHYVNTNEQIFIEKIASDVSRQLSVEMYLDRYPYLVDSIENAHANVLPLIKMWMSKDFRTITKRGYDEPLQVPDVETITKILRYAAKKNIMCDIPVITQFTDDEHKKYYEYLRFLLAARFLN